MAGEFDYKVTKQGTFECPSLLFDENGKPTRLFCASGGGTEPYKFDGKTYLICMKLERNT